MVRRTRLLSPCLTAVTSPISLMMPVNTTASKQRPLEHVESVIAHGLRGKALELWRARQRGHRLAIKRIDSISPNRDPGPKQRCLVHKVSPNKRGGKNGSGLNHEPGDTPFGQQRERRHEIKPAAHLSHAPHVDAPNLEGPLAFRRSALACDDP